jgi:DNA-binding MarR family transcriptional regulator
MGLNKGVVSRLVDRLEKRNFIKRTVSEKDRRLSSIELTPAGIKLVPKLAHLADENDEKFFGHLPKREREALAGFMRELVKHHGFKTKPIH